MWFHFLEAVEFLGCTRAWLTAQITAGRVRFILEDDGKGANRYLLSKADIFALRYDVPVFIPGPARPRKASRKVRVHKKTDLYLEARALDMTVEEYVREMGIDIAP
jgi:hypothetical protein